MAKPKPTPAAAVLFEDHFTAAGRLNSTNWEINKSFEPNNPAYLGDGKTFMRQELPFAESGMARIRLDTFAPGANTGKFLGSEAITTQAWDVKTGGIAFEGQFKFEGTQGGMIAGFFSYEKFNAGVDRNIHDEIDFEILTTQLKKISTNVFAHEPGDKTAHPISYPVAAGTFGEFHTYRMEWTPSLVQWFVDGQWIRSESKHVPQNPQQLHLNLWGVPGNWGPNPGDPKGPPVGDPNFVPTTNQGQSRSFFFDLDAVKVERLKTALGDSGRNEMVGTADDDAFDAGDGDDSLTGGVGDDTLIGGGGNDTIDGGDGNDAIFGGTGSNTLAGGAGNDAFDFGSGADSLRDRLADLNGDAIAEFGPDDALVIQGALIGRAALNIATGADATTLSVGGSSFELTGDFSGGDFMTVARGIGADAHTIVTFENFLPTLTEGTSVDPASINGVANEPFLTGDGSVRFTLELKSAVSAHSNTLGYYKVNADGTVNDVEILFSNTLNVPAAARTVDLGVPSDGQEIGFFLIQDGFDLYGNLPDNLSFVAPGTTTAADLDSGLPPILRSATLGNLGAGQVFHSFATFNPGDANQVLSGVTPGGRELQIGFEDLQVTSGDNDFQDVVVGIRVTPDDNVVL